MHTTVEYYQSLTDIDFSLWHSQGITCVLLDVDSTITPWLEPLVIPEILASIRQARKTGIPHIALVTNTNPTNKRRIQHIAAQIKADAYFMPMRFRERKPKPVLILKAMEHFGAAPQHVAMVGDKLSVDVRAAKRAGIARVAWVERLGTPDHPYDRYIRRPIESLFRPRPKRPN